jgi:hypothetical protein
MNVVVKLVKEQWKYTNNGENQRMKIYKSTLQYWDSFIQSPWFIKSEDATSWMQEFINKNEWHTSTPDLIGITEQYVFESLDKFHLHESIDNG